MIRMDLPLKDYVYSQLRERILYGHLHPHTCLLESGVSREFSVSRTPARLALQRLEKEGLIARNRSGPGWTVQIVRLEEILEIMELRTSLIDLMGKHALEKITPEEINGLWERMGRIDSLVSDRNIHEAADDCQRLRTALLSAAKMPLALKMWSSLPSLCNFNWLWSGISLNDHVRSISFNRPLVQSVSDRDFRGFQQIHHRQADEYLKCCLEVYRRIQRGSGKF